MADLYRRSSQFRQWSFTASKLAEIQAAAHAQAPEGLLTEKEERELVLFFASDRIEPFCEYFRLPSHVRATSVAYFRRFYLRHSVASYDPKLVLPTCVFLAAKVENFFIPIASFAEALSNIDQQEILDFEFTLFSELRFDLTVHNPLRPLHGFFLDMQSSSDFDVALLANMHDGAKALIVQAFGNDCQFLYTPAQIALAALMETNEFVLTQYLATTLDESQHSLDQLLAIVEECRQLLKLGNQVSLPKDQIKQIAKRLKSQPPDAKRRRG